MESGVPEAVSFHAKVSNRHVLITCSISYDFINPTDFMGDLPFFFSFCKYENVLGEISQRDKRWHLVCLCVWQVAIRGSRLQSQVCYQQAVRDWIGHLLSTSIFLSVKQSCICSTKSSCSVKPITLTFIICLTNSHVTKIKLLISQAIWITC